MLHERMAGPEAFSYFNFGVGRVGAWGGRCQLFREAKEMV